MTDFTHLHVHTEYSILDGATKVADLVNKSIADGADAVAVTDHGNMFAIKEFFDFVSNKNNEPKDKIKKLQKQIDENTLSEEEKTKALEEIEQLKAKKPFKPILGCEVYVAANSRLSKKTKEDARGYHLILLAKNATGYHNLIKLVSFGWVDGFYYDPRIDKELLEKYHEGIICSAACLGGEIQQNIINGDLAKAEEVMLWFKNLFGSDYYVEIQRHQATNPHANHETFGVQQMVNAKLIELAHKHNIKIIATNDVHFIDEAHAEAHDRLICLSTGKDLDDPKRLHYTMQEWLKTPDEMAQIFADIPEAISNTREIVDKVEFYSLNNPPIMPMYQIPEDFGTVEEYKKKFTEADIRAEFETDEKSKGKVERLGGLNKVYRIKLESDYLRELTMKGSVDRYGKNLSKELQDRINFELDVIKNMGFPGYFLIVQDFIQAARSIGVSVGPGRGSAAGSVVAYCLKITDIDPLKYDLLFERFLNPDRISLPDIDIDFDDEGRGKILRWVTEKYGKNRVAHIVTYGTMATKLAIKDVARVQHLPLAEANRLTNYIPKTFPEDAKTGKAPKVNLKNCIKLIPELKEASESKDENTASVLKYAEMLEGTVRQVGVHACGVIIGADDLTKFVPLSTAKDKVTGEDMIVTQYEGSVIESVGLIKMDFLGLITLSIINEALANIKKSRGETLDIDKIPIDDKKTYELFCKGATVGTFQFESAGMQKYLRDLKPSKFEDLIAMNALYRPGPMQYIPSFINRKHGTEKIEYDFPIMEKRLKDTYGITVYQEQVMLLSRDLAGFTRGESDKLRKAMGKKKIEEMKKLKVKFIEGATKNGFAPVEKLEKIWNDWAEFAKYAFNKSHATCYSWVAYQTAYLKAHYPAEYMAGVLTNNLSKIDEVSKLMDECKNMGIKVLPPDVNESDKTFTVNKEGNIRFGLAAVKGVGEGAVENIIEVRKNGAFTDVFDFVTRVNLTAVNRKTIESLALAGGFDSLGNISRAQFFATTDKGQFIDTLIWYGNLVQVDSKEGMASLFGDSHQQNIKKPQMPIAPEWSTAETLAHEKELIGIYLSSHPLDPYKFEIKTFCNISVTELSNLEALKGRSVCFAGMITSVKELLSKNNKPYGQITIEDYDGSYTTRLFGQRWIDNKKYFIKDCYLMIKAKVVERKQFGKVDPNAAKEYELHFDKISMLADVRDEYISGVEITLPLNKITNEFTEGLSKKMNSNKGKKRLSFMIVDENKKIRISQSSHNLKIDLNDSLIKYLNDEQLDFIIKTA